MRTLLAISALLVGLSANAQESTTKAKKEEIMKGQRQNAPVQEDIDQEITNAKMRADSGSKSKHSLSFTGSYSGATTDNVFGYERPRLTAGAATPARTSLAGDLNYRYRLTSKDSLTAGVGLNWVAPGHTLKEEDKANGITQYEASNPSVGYSRAYKIGGVQNITAGGMTKYSSHQVIEEEKTNFNFGIGHTALMEPRPSYSRASYPSFEPSRLLWPALAECRTAIFFSTALWVRFYG